jgi:N,N'-diacetyllegionaminate synthase
VSRPILIAECCQNHNGSRETLKRMIHEAAAAGADYAKIQAIRSREVTRRERFEEGEVDANGTRRTIQRPYAPEVARLAKLDLSLDDEAWFVDECRRAGVASMTTIFTRTAAREIKDLGFTAVKIASYDCRSYPLLRDARRWWSTIICSTGASLDAEIARAAEELRGTDFTLLHCVTIYPTPLEELHMRRMDWLRRFTPKVGFSDHTAPGATGLIASKIAFALGAECIERHYTVLRPDETRDGPVSITPAQLRELRDFADRPRTERMELVRRERPDWEAALGKVQRPLGPAEWLNRDYYAGRFASKIGGRDVFNWEDVDIDALAAQGA